MIGPPKVGTTRHDREDPQRGFETEASARRREPSRLDVDHPSIRRERTPNSTAVQYPAMVGQPAGVVHMLGEQSTSVSDAIQGEWETREVYVAGG